MTTIQYLSENPEKVTAAALLAAFLFRLVRSNAELIVSRAASLLFESRSFSGEALAAIQIYFRNHAEYQSVSKWPMGIFGGRVRLKKDNSWRFCFMIGGNSERGLILYKGMPIWRKVGMETGMFASPSAVFMNIRGAVDWDKILAASASNSDDAQKASESKFCIKRFGSSSRSNRTEKDPPDSKEALSTLEQFIKLGGASITYPADDIGPLASADPIGNLALTKEMESVINDAQFWMKNKEWYLQRGIKWRKARALYGKPGTGKTSLVRALAQQLGIPIHIFELSNLEPDTLQQCWEASSLVQPRIVLFEDFDRVFHGDKNMIANNGLTLSDLLNIIDGVDEANGLFIFITANDHTKLDPALVRPGRLYPLVEIKPPDYNGRYKIAFRVTKNHEMASKIAAVDGRTGAEVQQEAEEMAIKDLWQEVDNERAAE
jgi:hypothetical protein